MYMLVTQCGVGEREGKVDRVGREEGEGGGLDIMHAA